MRPRLLEIGAALFLHQLGHRIGEDAGRIDLGGIAQGFDEHRPAGAQPAQGVVQTGGSGNELGGSR